MMQLKSIDYEKEYSFSNGVYRNVAVVGVLSGKCSIRMVFSSSMGIFNPGPAEKSDYQGHGIVSRF